jgi:beta-N-acetylhexosaminidase
MRTRALLLAAAVGAAGCLLGVRPAETAPPPVGEQLAVEPTSAVAGRLLPRPASDCDHVMADLSLRERLGQLVMAGLDPGDVAAASRTVTVDRVGAVFIGGNATALLTGGQLAALRAKASLPLLTAVDEEGGRVQRIDALDGATPSARELADSMSPGQVTSLAEQRGKQLRARGVVMDLAPVVDVSDAPADTVIGDRAFSGDAATVGTYAGAYADGLRRAGVVPVLKHFPGHGRGDGDSHAGLVRTPPLASLEADDLQPYATLIPRGASVVMLGHLDVPGLTDGAPASLSPAAYRLLRGQYRFDGVAMTDDLGAMKAVTDAYSLPDAVTKAIVAGADIALWSAPAPTGPILDRLENAVRTGELSQDRVLDAVTHVLRLKTGCR